jgi:purine-binding chemotaxis protein CheW
MTEEAGTIRNKSASRIDWLEIHGRLDRGKAALEQRAALTFKEKTEILKARAKLLAREPEEEKGEQESVAFVEFLLAYERYAIESAYVREVYPLKEFTPLPGTPLFVFGIINVRGRIVSVVDLKKFFDLSAKGLPDLNRVIIIGNDDMEFGLLADAVSGLRQIPISEIQPPLSTLTGIRAEYLKGVTADQLVVLSAAKLLGDPRINVCQPADA